MDKFYSKGDFLKVETVHNECFVGRLFNQKKDKSSISLYDVYEMTQNKLLEGRMTFLCDEIKSLKLSDEPVIEDVPSKMKNIELTNVEIEDLAVISKSFIFINQIDETYKEALNELFHYSYVAVGTEGSEMGRKCKLSLLTLSTPKQIYIFDIQVMQSNAFQEGLRKLLEHKEIKKIVHNSKNLSDCLYHRHQVELNNVFDTQVADVIAYKNKHGYLPEKFKTLQECITHYLGLSNNLDEKVDIVEWSQRPVAVHIKEIASQNIVYMHRLSEILYENMMKPFTNGVEYFVNCLRQSNELEAWRLSGQEKSLTEEFKEAIGCNKKN